MTKARDLANLAGSATVLATDSEVSAAFAAQKAEEEAAVTAKAAAKASANAKLAALGLTADEIAAL